MFPLVHGKQQARIESLWLRSCFVDVEKDAEDVGQEHQEKAGRVRTAAYNHPSLRDMNSEFVEDACA